MRYWWVVFLLSFSPLDGLQRIAVRNQHALQAEEAYKKGQFQVAAALYEKVRAAEDGTPPTSVLLNLAHAYFRLHAYSQASPLYRALLKLSLNSETKSLVANQLSIIEAEEGNFTKALAYSKQAITTNEHNQDARYNYELLQKYLLLHPEKRQGPPPTQRNKGNGSQRNSPSPGPGNSLQGGNGTQPGGATPAPQPGQNGSDQQQARGNSPGNQRGQSNATDPNNPNGRNGQGSNRPGGRNDAVLQTRYERLQKLNLTPEKARQLLDAMRQEEAQYLQQLPRRKARTKEDDLPDW